MINSKDEIKNESERFNKYSKNQSKETVHSLSNQSQVSLRNNKRMQMVNLSRISKLKSNSNDFCTQNNIRLLLENLMSNDKQLVSDSLKEVVEIMFNSLIV